MKESEKKVEDFKSFNDFFIRKLKKGSRVFSDDKNIAILPADARYMAFQDLSIVDGFYVKGKKFSLSSFLPKMDFNLCPNCLGPSSPY